MMSVLLIDDEPGFRELALLHFKKNFGNMKVFEATNPVEGLSLFEKNKDTIRYVFCDFYLPIQNGSDFVELVKKNNPNVYVCLVTGDDIIQKEKHAPHVDRVFYKLDGFEQIIDFIKKH